MTKQEATERFDALPPEDRKAIIENSIDLSIKFIELEKKNWIRQYLDGIKRYNQLIENENKWLKVLNESLEYHEKVNPYKQY